MERTEMQQGYAAWVTDPTHQVEFGLYPYPETQEALVATLASLAEMPHSPEEAAEIRTRLAARAQSFLSAEEYTQLCEGIDRVEDAADAPEAVQLKLSEENYALVYAAMQVAQEQVGPLHGNPAAETAPLGAEVPSPAEGDRSVSFSERAREILAAAACEKYEEGMALARELKDDVARVQEAVNALAPAAPADPTSTTDVTSPALTEARAESARYLAESVALYLQLLRKPQARDKQVEALAAELAARGVDALRYQLEDLRLEYSAGAGGAAQLTQIPRVPDPTEAGSADAAVNEDDPKLALDDIEETRMGALEEFTAETHLWELFHDPEGKFKARSLATGQSPALS